MTELLTVWLTAGNELLGKFCSDLEKSIVESIEAGFYTKARTIIWLAVGMRLWHSASLAQQSVFTMARVCTLS